MFRAFFTLIAAVSIATSALAADTDLEKLQGKWETKKTNDDGQKITQSFELKKDKLLFKITDSSGNAVLMVTAEVKSQKAGSFSTFTISNIKAGREEDSLEPVEGERSYVFLPGYKTVTIVSNMDEERDQPPSIDVYNQVSK